MYSLNGFIIRSQQRMTNALRHIPYIGIGRFCPVCGKQSKKFAAFGVVPREDAMCTYCGALERHRFIWLFFKKMTNLFEIEPKEMLHIAPEPAFEASLRKHLRNGYLTADLNDPNAMVKMDITDIRYPNGTFDVIYCSHVFMRLRLRAKSICQCQNPRRCTLGS